MVNFVRIFLHGEEEEEHQKVDSLVSLRFQVSVFTETLTNLHS